MGGGKPATTTEHVTAQKDPYGPATPYFPSLYERGAQTLAGLPEHYVAGPNDKQIMANDQLYSLAGGAGGTSGTMLDMAKRIASGEFLDPSKNMAFAGAADAATAPITKAFTEKVLPGLTNTAIQAGGAGTGPSAFGGASLGVPQMSAVDDWTRAIGDVTSKMALDYSKLGMQMMPLATEYSKEAEAQRLMPAAIAASAGGQQQQWDQGSLNDLIQKYTQGMSGVQNFANILSTGGYGSQVQDSTKVQQAAEPSLMTQILQGLGGAAGIAGSMFGAPAGGTSAVANLMNMFRGTSTPAATDTRTPLLYGPGY